MTSYTGADIEIHLSDWTQGMETDGIDVDASLERARDLVRQTFQDRYPQFSVAVYTERAHGFQDSVVRWPEILRTPDEDWKPVIERALEGLWERLDAWIVEATPNA